MQGSSSSLRIRQSTAPAASSGPAAQTLSSVIKRVENILSYYNIQIVRKPYYGICAQGAEFDKRCCLIRYFSADSAVFRLLFA